MQLRQLTNIQQYHGAQLNKPVLSWGCQGLIFLGVRERSSSNVSEILL